MIVATATTLAGFPVRAEPLLNAGSALIAGVLPNRTGRR
jgi:hypothetical protein